MNIKAINKEIETLNKSKIDTHKISDGYHTFEELYDFRLLYNALSFNLLSNIVGNPYKVYKSKKHSDGEFPFGKDDWFIVYAQLPDGQISNHYEMKYWDYFNLIEESRAPEWDGHTSQDVAKRMRKFILNNKD